MMKPELRTPTVGIDSVEHEARLHELWETSPGWKGFFTTVDHKEIGIRYMITAFIFLALGGVEALIMRVQLARPDQHLLTPDQYDQLFSTHGMTMIFLYAMPILSGFSNYLWALLLGARYAPRPRRRCPKSACTRRCFSAVGSPTRLFTTFTVSDASTITYIGGRIRLPPALIAPTFCAATQRFCL